MTESRIDLAVRGAHELCVAPMMDWTDRHCRAFHRLFGPGIVLYTEMVTAKALLHGDAARLLAHDASEHPLALQLGGADPGELARAAAIGVSAGFDEINLNVGCPSDRVASGSFGACLMADPERVARCISAMHESVAATGSRIPVTVKCRLGIDGPDCPGLDNDVHLAHFIDTVAAAGCSLFIVHARKAILGGLSPKENREIPPLQYERVHALARRRPDLEIILNGGLADAAACVGQRPFVDGVMIGRAAWHDPMMLLATVGALSTAREGTTTPSCGDDPLTILERHLPRVRAELAAGEPLSRITRPLLGILHGRPGARAFRRHLSERVHLGGAGIEVLEEAMERVRATTAEHAPAHAA